MPRLKSQWFEDDGVGSCSCLGNLQSKKASVQGDFTEPIPHSQGSYPEKCMFSNISWNVSMSGFKNIQKLCMLTIASRKTKMQVHVDMDSPKQLFCEISKPFKNSDGSPHVQMFPPSFRAQKAFKTAAALARKFVL